LNKKETERKRNIEGERGREGGDKERVREIKRVRDRKKSGIEG
jgi:hypothetical protein